MATKTGRPASEISLLDEARTVPIPYAGGNEYVCPACERPIPTEMQIRLGKPPRYEAVLNDVLKCPLPKKNPTPGQLKAGTICGFIFSPRSEATVIRQ